MTQICNHKLCLNQTWFVYDVIGHFGDDLSDSFNWCKNPLLNQIKSAPSYNTEILNNNYNNYNMYIGKTKSNKTINPINKTINPGLNIFYAKQP